MAGYFPAPGINENDLAYIEKGDYASQAIPKGAFVEWNGKVRTAKAAILQGATLSASLFDDVNSGGALNRISDHIGNLAESILGLVFIKEVSANGSTGYKDTGISVDNTSDVYLLFRRGGNENTLMAIGGIYHSWRSSWIGTNNNKYTVNMGATWDAVAIYKVQAPSIS